MSRNLPGWDTVPHPNIMSRFNDVCLNGKQHRIIGLVQESEKSRKLRLKLIGDDKYLEVGERVEILSNWRPDLGAV